MFLLIDNYDSFTYNVVNEFHKLEVEFKVLYNDDKEIINLAKSDALSRVCISPGPSSPENAGFCLEFLRILNPKVPVLGICLGHQLLAYNLGIDIVIAPKIMHGKTSKVNHNSKGLFKGVSSSVQFCRYHSLVIKLGFKGEQSLINIDAISEDDNQIMAISYKDRPWYGVQFHPESIISPEGSKIIKNFIDIEKPT